MRNYRSKSGPFTERPYYKTHEIEDLCAEELRKVNLFPSSPQPIRIDRFIEKRFGVVPQYDELPDGVLGFTRFTSNGVAAVVVSRVLSEEGTASAERRINTTLAHEAGHGLLHSHLFAVGCQPERLFGAEIDPNTPKILCRDEKDKPFPKYDGRWWEYQANQTIGALLLPRSLVEQCLNSGIFESVGSFGIRQLNPAKRESAIELLASTFEVNPAVATIRLDQLFPESDSAQLTL